MSEKKDGTELEDMTRYNTDELEFKDGQLKEWMKN